MSGPATSVLHLTLMLIALAWFGLALWLALRPAARMAVLLPGRWWLVAVAAAMAAWSWFSAQAGLGAGAATSIHVRNLAMLGWLFVAFHPRTGGKRNPSLTLIYALLIALSVVAALGGLLTSLWLANDATNGDMAGPNIGQIIVQMLTASGGLLLVDQIIRTSEGVRRIPLLVATGAMAALWAYDLNIFLISALAGHPATTLMKLEPLISLFLIPPFVLAAMDAGRERVRMSRALAFRGIILVGLATYLVVISLTGTFAKLIGRDYGELAQSLFLAIALNVGIWRNDHFILTILIDEYISCLNQFYLSVFLDDRA